MTIAIHHRTIPELSAMVLTADPALKQVQE